MLFLPFPQWATRSRNPLKLAYIFFKKLNTYNIRASCTTQVKANRNGGVTCASLSFPLDPVISYLLLSTSLPPFSPSLQTIFHCFIVHTGEPHQCSQLYIASSQAAIASLKLHIPGGKFEAGAQLTGREMEKNTAARPLGNREAGQEAIVMAQGTV